MGSNSKCMVWFFSVIFILFGLQFRCSATDYIKGQYDKEVLKIFIESKSVFTLGKTKLNKIALEYYFIRMQNYDWLRAKKEANKKFFGDPDKRALFLSKYINKGDSVRLIDDLELTDMGGSTLTGMGHSKSYGLYVKYNKKKMVWFTKGEKNNKNVGSILLPEVKAILTFWIAHGRIVEEATLCLRNYKYKGIEFYNLTFDKDDVLSGFDRIVTKDNGFIIRIAGNFSGETGTPHYYAEISKNNKYYEAFDISNENELIRKKHWTEMYNN